MSFAARLSLGRLLVGGLDGLSYLVVLALAGPLVSGIAGAPTYAKLAFVVLISALGTLFNITSVNGMIHTLSKESLSQEERSQILFATLLLTVIGSLVFAAVLVPLLKLSGASHLFDPNEMGSAGLVGWALSACISIDGIVAGTLKARHAFKLTATVEVAKAVCLILLLWWAAAHGSWLACAWSLVICVFSGALIKGFTVARSEKTDLPDLAKLFAAVKVVTHANIWQWSLLISAFLFQQADRLVLAPRLGAADFAAYNFCWQIALVVQAASAASLIHVLPEATLRASQKSRGFLSAAYARDLKVGLGFATFISFAAALSGAWLFRSSLLPQVLQQGHAAFLTLIVCGYLFAINVVPYYYSIALGKLPWVASVTIFGAALSLGTAFLLIEPLGLLGLAVAKVWGIVTLSCFWFSRTALRTLDTQRTAA